MTLLLIIGIQGSGKGTQGAMIAEKLGYRVVSTGEVLRANASDEQKARLQAGELFGDQEMITLIDEVFNSADASETLIMDGFPRSIAQAEWLMNQVKAGRFKLESALHLVASRSAVKKRLLKRGRSDDTDAAIEARFDQYEKSTHPLIDWLKSQGIKVININAEQTVEKVNEEILRVISA